MSFRPHLSQLERQSASTYCAIAARPPASSPIQDGQSVAVETHPAEHVTLMQAVTPFTVPLI